MMFPKDWDPKSAAEDEEWREAEEAIEEFERGWREGEEAAKKHIREEEEKKKETFPKVDFSSFHEELNRLGDWLRAQNSPTSISNKEEVLKRNLSRALSALIYISNMSPDTLEYVQGSAIHVARFIVDDLLQSSRKVL